MRLDGFDLFIGFCLVVFFTIAGYAIYRSDVINDRCAAKGGTMVETFGGYKCLDLKTLEIK